MPNGWNPVKIQYPQVLQDMYQNADMDIKATCEEAKILVTSPLLRRLLRKLFVVFITQRYLKLFQCPGKCKG